MNDKQIKKSPKTTPTTERASYFAKADAQFYDGSKNISVRSPTSRDVYNSFRPNEAIPNNRTQNDLQDIMLACNDVYKKVGVVRSVIDMMSEFAVDGLDICHEDEGQNKFWQAWAKKIKLRKTAERFSSWFLKAGNVVVRREYAVLEGNDIRELKRTIAAPVPFKAGRIPIQYKFYNPATIDVVGDFVGTIPDKQMYAIKIPMSNFQAFSRPRNELEREVYDSLPKEIKDAIEGKNFQGTYYVPIPADKVYVDSYKKDDSELWGTSFLYSILNDIYYLDKLKLAKISALDGVINAIRIWKLGDHKEKLYPSPAMGAKLANILAQHTGGGAIDIIWDSAIELQESYPPLGEFINTEENLNSILLGLGVPEVLIGGTSDKNIQVSQVGLKTILKRVECTREAIIQWLETEIDIIHQNMGFTSRPTIKFNYADFYDDKVYFDLIKEFTDRNIISNSRALEIIKENPEIESAQIQKEQEQRKAKELPPKAGPFHNPQLQEQQKFELAKLNSSNMSKENLSDKKNGRPFNSKDTVPRKQRSISVLVASQIHDYVDEFVNKIMMQHYNIKDSRQLTAEHKSEMENAKIRILPLISPQNELNDESIAKAFENKRGPADLFVEYYNNSLKSCIDKLTNDQKRLLKIDAYINAWESANENL